MKLSSARLVVTAGLAAALALGGCSVSSKTETTTSVSDGETTTTTTTTTEDGSTTTETTETATSGTESGDVDLASLKSYTLDAYGIHYDLPDGFTFTEVNGSVDLSQNPAVAFSASNESSGGELFLRFLTVDGQPDVLSDSFLADREAECKKSVEDAGGTVKNITRGEVEAGQNKFPTITVEAEKEGSPAFMEFLYFSITADGDVHAVGQLGATSDSAEKVDAMIKGFTIQ